MGWLGHHHKIFYHDVNPFRIARCDSQVKGAIVRVVCALRKYRIVQLKIDPTLREPINSQHLFQHLESCQPTPIPGPGTWQPKRLKPSSLSSLKVKILRKITSISAKLNEKTLITCDYITFTRLFFVLDHFVLFLLIFDFWPLSGPSTSETAHVVEIPVARDQKARAHFLVTRTRKTRSKCGYYPY